MEDPPGGVEVDLDEIEARWVASWTPEEVARRLSGVAAPWYVAAGWALDLFRGRQTREHGDIEVAVPAARFAEVRDRLPGYAFDAAGSGRIWQDASAAELAGTHQTWVRDPGTGQYLVDVFREPHDGDLWVCRRDESIRLPYTDIIQFSAEGIPYLAPEWVLLFKAKAVRAKDQKDFDGVVPLLTSQQRETLAELLQRVHPGHGWLAAL